MKKMFVLLVPFLFLMGCERPSADEESVTEMLNDVIEVVDQNMYTEYTEESFAELEGKQKFMIFFHVDWCLTASAWDKRLIKSLSELPENTKILKADYDLDTALVEKYNIKIQATAVFIDETGELIETIINPSIETVQDFFNNLSIKKNPILIIG